MVGQYLADRQAGVFSHHQQGADQTLEIEHPLIAAHALFLQPFEKDADEPLGLALVAGRHGGDDLVFQQGVIAVLGVVVLGRRVVGQVLAHLLRRGAPAAQCLAGLVPGRGDLLGACENPADARHTPAAHPGADHLGRALVDGFDVVGQRFLVLGAGHHDHRGIHGHRTEEEPAADFGGKALGDGLGDRLTHRPGHLLFKDNAEHEEPVAGKGLDAELLHRAVDGLEAGLAAQDVQQELLFELAALGLYQLLHILLVLGSAGHAGGQIVELVLVLFPPAKHIVGLVEQFPDGTIEEGAVPPADQQHDDRGQQDEHRDPEGRDAGPEVLLFVVGGITGDAVEVDGLALHKVVADGAGDAQMPVREVAGIGQRVGQLGVGGGDGLAVRVEQHHVIAQRLPLPCQLGQVFHIEMDQQHSHQAVLGRGDPCHEALPRHVQPQAGGLARRRTGAVDPVEGGGLAGLVVDEGADFLLIFHLLEREGAVVAQHPAVAEIDVFVPDHIGIHIGPAPQQLLGIPQVAVPAVRDFRTAFHPGKAGISQGRQVIAAQSVKHACHPHRSVAGHLAEFGAAAGELAAVVQDAAQQAHNEQRDCDQQDQTGKDQRLIPAALFFLRGLTVGRFREFH